MKPLPIFDPNSDRVVRGGSWSNSMLLARVAYRNWRPPSFRSSIRGFRSCWSIR